MRENLTKHIKKFVKINAEDEAEILDFFEPETFAKKANLMSQNTRCKNHFFVVKGCLRMFFVNEKGMEQTIQFAIENWWITDYLAFERQAQSEFAIQAIEATEVLKISYNDQEKLLDTFPQLEGYFRKIYQRAYSASQLRTKYLLDFSREQFYHHFNDHYPEFTRRIPQHMLASFLNMTPEYLSEIKKKSRT
ncbi:MAG: cyclic nucleotide-binding protein [Bacteroidales bacterium 45-6]|mgnify:FL=1|nr:MAG: cyclic nucleotide-binding protein [Bacteroidales bacterium 45-6]